VSEKWSTLLEVFSSVTWLARTNDSSAMLSVTAIFAPFGQLQSRG
jgi:hypothetical protein